MDELTALAELEAAARQSIAKLPTVGEAGRRRLIAAIDALDDFRSANGTLGQRLERLMDRATADKPLTGRDGLRNADDLPHLDLPKDEADAALAALDTPTAPALDVERLTAESILAKVRTMPGLVGITESEINRRELSDWITNVFLSPTTETPE
jgi:hypothetical protein